MLRELSDRMTVYANMVFSFKGARIVKFHTLSSYMIDFKTMH